MSRKKILFIPRWYPDRNDSMLGLFVQKHATAVQAYHDVTVLYVTADNTINENAVIIAENDFGGIHEIRIYFGKNKGALTNAFGYWNCYRKGLRMVKKRIGSPDLVHVHILTRTAFPAIWLKITSAIPYVITEHWSRYLPDNLKKGSFPGWWRRWFTRYAVGKSEAITTVSENLAIAMQRLGMKGNYFLTPNIADTGAFHPVQKQKRNIKKLIHISCFDEPAKNIKGIIQVTKELSKIRSDFQLEIVGDGKDFNEVYNFALQSGLVNERIFFTGLLTGNDLVTKLADADGMVMFSNYENFPCTIVESMACSVPVISTNVGGIAEHLLPEFGILIPPGNQQSLKDAIIELLDHPDKFDYEGMRKYAIENFSMESSGRLFSSIYQKALHN